MSSNGSFSNLAVTQNTSLGGSLQGASASFSDVTASTLETSGNGSFGSLSTGTSQLGSASANSLSILGNITFPYQSASQTVTPQMIYNGLVLGNGGIGATQAWVNTQINNLIGAAPGLLDTLAEIDQSIGSDPHFNQTVTNAIAQKAALAGENVFTGGVNHFGGNVTIDGTLSGPTISAIDANLNSLAGQINTEATQLLGDITSINSTTAALQSQLLTLTNTVSTNANAANSHLSTLDATTSTQSTHLSTVDSSLNAVNSHLSTLDVTTGNHTSHLSTLDTSLNAVNSHLSTLDVTTGNQTSHLSTLDGSFNTINTSLQSLSTTVGNNYTTEQNDKSNLQSQITSNLTAQNNIVSEYGLDASGNLLINGSINKALKINADSTTFNLCNTNVQANVTNSFSLYQGSAGDSVVNSGPGQSLEFKIGNNEKMRIDPSGNIGIGTSTPMHALDVSGNIHCGNASVDSNLWTQNLNTQTINNITPYFIGAYFSNYNDTVISSGCTCNPTTISNSYNITSSAGGLGILLVVSDGVSTQSIRSVGHYISGGTVTSVFSWTVNIISGVGNPPCHIAFVIL